MTSKSKNDEPLASKICSVSLEHNDTIILKKEKVATIISNLYQNKVVYREHCMGIVTISNIQLESDFFLATAKPCLLLPTSLRADEVFLKK